MINCCHGAKIFHLVVENILLWTDEKYLCHGICYDSCDGCHTTDGGSVVPGSVLPVHHHHHHQRRAAPSVAVTHRLSLPLELHPLVMVAHQLSQIIIQFTIHILVSAEYSLPSQ